MSHGENWMARKRRERQEAKEAFLDELAVLPAVLETREGREYRVIRIPDRYGERGPTGGTYLREGALDSLGEKG